MNIDKPNMTKDFLIVLDGILLPAMITGESSWKAPNKRKRIIVKVVVFMPPAVPPGEPPININTIVSISDG